MPENFQHSYWSATMEQKENKIDSDGLAEVWWNAEHRRTEEIGAWLGHILEKQRLQKLSDAEARYPQGNPILR